MFLHLGKNVVVRKSAVTAVCDIDNATCAKSTREFLSRAEKSGELVVATDDIPRSFVVCSENGVTTVYLSQFTPATLARRGL